MALSCLGSGSGSGVLPAVCCNMVLLANTRRAIPAARVLMLIVAALSLDVCHTLGNLALEPAPRNMLGSAEHLQPTADSLMKAAAVDDIMVDIGLKKAGWDLIQLVDDGHRSSGRGRTGPAEEDETAMLKSDAAQNGRAESAGAAATQKMWTIEFGSPVLVSGTFNTSSALGPTHNRRNLHMLTDSLTVPCLFFPIERYAKHIFSIEQDYGIGNLRYPGPPDQSWEGTPMGNRPYVYSSVRRPANSMRNATKNIVIAIATFLMFMLRFLMFIACNRIVASSFFVAFRALDREFADL